MTGTITPPPDAVLTADRATTTRALLACGVVAGVLFIVVSFGQVVTRSGFDLSVNPLSALSLGDLGWIQITNFLLTGLLAIAFAVGLRRALHPGRAGTWGPRLVTAYGVGLMSAGVFVADPANGFPSGAPAGLPDQLSWHAGLHAVSAMVAFVSVAAACFVLARRFADLRRRTLATYGRATGVATLVLTAWPSSDGASARFAVAAVLTSVWLAVMATQLRSLATTQRAGTGGV